MSQVLATEQADRPTASADVDGPEETPDARRGRLHSLRLEAPAAGEGRSTAGMARRLVTVAVIVAVAAAGYAAVRNPSLLAAVGATRLAAFLSQTPSVPAVRVSSELDLVLSLSGVIEPETTVSITPLVPGMIVELPVSEGDLVEEGQLLAKILDTNYQADLAEAEAALALAESQLLELKNGSLPEEVRRAAALVAQAKATLEADTRQMERIKQLREKGSVTAREYDSSVARQAVAEADYDRLVADYELVEIGPRAEMIAAAEAEVARAAARVDRAKFFIENASVYAPVAGTVLERNGEVGEVIRAEYYLTDLVAIGDLSSMLAEVEVQERDVSRVSVGQTCRVIPDAFPDALYAGEVIRIRPKVNRQRGVVNVTVRIDTPDSKLFAEMNGRVEFLRDGVDPLVRREGVITVPVAAVRDADGKNPSVCVVASGAVAVRPVTLSGENATAGETVTVVDGLAEGDVLLLDAGGLEDGQPVEPDFAAGAT